MITLINLKKDKDLYFQSPKDFVYIGRENRHLNLLASKWANPFVMKREADREEVLKKFKEYILNIPELLFSLHELDNKVLACYCSPKRCHGNILIELRQLQLDGYL